MGKTRLLDENDVMPIPLSEIDSIDDTEVDPSDLPEYEGDITDEEIDNMLKDDTTKNK